MHAAKWLATLGVSALVLTGLSTATEHFDLPRLAALTDSASDAAASAGAPQGLVPRVPRETDAATPTVLADTKPQAAQPLVAEPVAAMAADAAPGRKLYRICRVTAYHDRGTTASGVQSGVGQCAAPGDIPFGAKIHIPALGRTFVATDRTHRRFRKSTVDIFMPRRGDCIQFGERFLECVITLPQ